MPSWKHFACLLVLPIFPAALAFAVSNPKPVRGAALIETAEPAAVTLWVDARPERKFNEQHIPGALRLTEEEWDVLIEPVLQQWNLGTPVMVYCEPGCGSSAEVAARLRAMGLEPVNVLEGGMAAWAETQR